MAKLSTILRKIGKTWIVLAIVYIILSYCLNLFVSDEPFIQRFLAFINIWNLFLCVLLILPGYLLTTFSEKLEQKRVNQ